MLDTSHISSQQQSTFTFYATGNWQTFQKPRNAKFIEIFCLGGGAGGGGGGGLATTGQRSGGSGGSSAGIVRGIIPAFLLPDTLYIFVGKGGIGGLPGISVGTNGGSGNISYISLQPSISEQTLICKSSTTTGTGGTGGTNTAPAGGSAATIAVVVLSAFGNLGIFTAVGGVAGAAAGGNNGVSPGASQTALATNLVTGGAGGGSKGTGASDGGGIIPAPVILTSAVNGGISSISGDATNGESGYGTLQPFCSTGGAGGGATNFTTSKGGRGGNGYFGSGGGGGGAGTAFVGNNGGDGGDGIVIITVIT